MGIFALVKDGVVINTVIWEGDEFDFGEGVTPVEVMEGVSVSPGYLYQEGEFVAPPLTTEQQEELRKKKVSDNLATKSSLLAYATENIAPLQDAVDLEEATEEETALLLAWKKYRIAVNRIDANTPDDIDWPEQPA